MVISTIVVGFSVAMLDSKIELLGIVQSKALFKTCLYKSAVFTKLSGQGKVVILQ